MGVPTAYTAESADGTTVSQDQATPPCVHMPNHQDDAAFCNMFLGQWLTTSSHSRRTFISDSRVCRSSEGSAALACSMFSNPIAASSCVAAIQGTHHKEPLGAAHPPEGVVPKAITPEGALERFVSDRTSIGVLALRIPAHTHVSKLLMMLALWVSEAWEHMLDTHRS
jgi:hypothetical protein